MRIAYLFKTIFLVAANGVPSALVPLTLTKYVPERIDVPSVAVPSHVQLDAVTSAVRMVLPLMSNTVTVLLAIPASETVRFADIGFGAIASDTPSGSAFFTDDVWL